MVEPDYPATLAIDQICACETCEETMARYLAKGGEEPHPKTLKIFLRQFDCPFSAAECKGFERGVLDYPCADPGGSD